MQRNKSEGRAAGLTIELAPQDEGGDRSVDQSSTGGGDRAGEVASPAGRHGSDSVPSRESGRRCDVTSPEVVTSAGNGRRSGEQAPTSGRRRVSPLSPDDRRAALIEATLPLLKEHGTSVSTRQIAEAAGVAEGTIFRAFPDKNALLIAAVTRGVEIPETPRRMWGIDADLDLRSRLTMIIDMSTSSMRRLGRLPEVMRSLMADEATRDEIVPVMTRNRAAALDAFVEVFEPNAACLRVSARHAARMALAMAFSSMGLGDGSETLTTGEMVAVLLDGLLAPGGSPTDGDTHSAR